MIARVLLIRMLAEQCKVLATSHSQQLMAQMIMPAVELGNVFVCLLARLTSQEYYLIPGTRLRKA